jgi:hypothetical protein
MVVQNTMTTCECTSEKTGNMQKIIHPPTHLLTFPRPKNNSPKHPSPVSSPLSKKGKGLTLPTPKPQSYQPLQDPPILLHPKPPILLPLVIKRRKKVHPASLPAKNPPNTLHRGLLILITRHRHPIALPRMRPPRLGNHHLLPPAHRVSDAANLLLDPLPGFGGCDGGIEEGMRVRGAEVRRGAEFRVRDQGVERIDGDDRAFVACLAQNLPRGAKRGYHIPRAGSARVDELVPDADGGDGAAVEVAVELCDHGGEVRGDGGDGEEAGEDLDVVGLRGGDDGGDLVAVDPVDAHGREGGEGAEVGGYLVLGFAGAVGVVGGVTDPEAGGWGGGGGGRCWRG